MCLFCSGCQHHTLIPTKDATAPLQQNKKHKDLCPHLAQDKMVFTGLQTIQILAMQGDIHIHIHMLAHESCTARVPVSAAFPRMRHADLHSSLDGSDALPCLLHGCCTTPQSSDFISKQIPDLFQSFVSNLPARQEVVKYKLILDFHSWHSSSPAISA